MPDAQVKVFGFAMTGSLVLAGTVATLGRDLFGSGAGTADGAVFNVLMYVSAAFLMALLAWAPMLAHGLDGRAGDGRGKVIAMAISEGTALMGIVGAGFAGQAMWAVALTLTGILTIARVISS